MRSNKVLIYEDLYIRIACLIVLPFMNHVYYEKCASIISIEHVTQLYTEYSWYTTIGLRALRLSQFNVFNDQNSLHMVLDVQNLWWAWKTNYGAFLLYKKSIHVGHLSLGEQRSNESQHIASVCNKYWGTIFFARGKLWCTFYGA